MEEEKLEVNNESESPREICGFWRRIFALLIDGLILAVPGYILGLIAFEQLVALGGWGKVVGFFISMLYFGIQNSLVCKGQTIGKRICKIMVVNKRGEFLSLPKSFIRIIVLDIGFFLNGAMIPDNLMNSPFMILISILVFGFMFSIIYLYIFNRTTRQSLHDLLVGSYVVNDSIAGSLKVQNIWRLHYAVVSIFIIASAGVPFYTMSLATQEPFDQILALRQNILSVENVGNATVTVGENTTTINNETKKTYYIASNIILNRKVENYDDLANEIAEIILSYDDYSQKDIISINITYGFDIGISSMWMTQRYGHTPEEWRTRL
jgi:uncharacterized RDD family membrane protein YckC